MTEEKVKIEGCNGKKIQGIMFYPERENPPAVIMVHGYGGEGLEEYWIETAKSICKEGFAVFTFIFTAYNSVPDVTNISLEDEIGELKKIIDFVENQSIDKERIGVFAQSLGTSVSIISKDPRIKVYVLLGANPKLKSLLMKILFPDDVIEKLKKQGYSDRKRISTGEMRKIGVRFLNEINEIGDITEEQIKNLDKPVLLVWGSKDNATTMEQAKEFYEMFNEPKKFFIVENAPHVTFRNESQRKIVLKEVIDWFNRWLK